MITYSPCLNLKQNKVLSTGNRDTPIVVCERAHCLWDPSTSLVGAKKPKKWYCTRIVCHFGGQDDALEVRELTPEWIGLRVETRLKAVHRGGIAALAQAPVARRHELWPVADRSTRGLHIATRRSRQGKGWSCSICTAHTHDAWSPALDAEHMAAGRKGSDWAHFSQVAHFHGVESRDWPRSPRADRTQNPSSSGGKGCFGHTGKANPNRGDLRAPCQRARRSCSCKTYPLARRRRAKKGRRRRPVVRAQLRCPSVHGDRDRPLGNFDCFSVGRCIARAFLRWYVVLPRILFTWRSQQPNWTNCKL
jgi:hypothetical protein